MEIKVSSTLNSQQKLAVEYSGESQCLLIMAGAGCGKTKTIMERIKFNLLSGIEPERILAITFTNRSAKEMKERLFTEISHLAGRVNIGTFHEFCLKVIRAMPKSFGISGSNILDAEDQYSLMKKARNKILPDKLHESFMTHSEILKIYSYSRNCCRDIVAYLYEKTSYDDQMIMYFVEIVEEYRRLKDSHMYVDFDDILEVFNKTLNDKPDLKTDLCSVFDEILVDEMQDTNPLQMQILQHFASKQVRLFCVGDPAQSIYKFRGAEFEHAYNFDSILPNSAVIKLNLNYRSTQKILDFSNWLLNRSSYKYNNDLKAFRDVQNAQDPVVRTFYTQQDEIEWIGSELLKKSTRGEKFSDCLVLVRTMNDGNQIELELIKRNIPYLIVGGMSLTKLAHIKDVLSMVKLITNNKDELSWIRFLCLWPKVGSKTATRITNDILNANSPDEILRILETNSSTKVFVHNAFRECYKYKNSPMQLVKAISEVLSPNIEKKYDKWASRQHELEMLVVAAGKYKDVETFISDFTLEPGSSSALDSENSQIAEKGRVVISTVHGAKGTEYDNVYVALACPGKYPHIQSVGSIKDEEEERRILYVAITRAKNELYITRNTQCRFYDLNTIPSEGEAYFLDTLPKNIININFGATYKKKFSNIGFLRDNY